MPSYLIYLFFGMTGFIVFAALFSGSSSNNNSSGGGSSHDYDECDDNDNHSSIWTHCNDDHHNCFGENDDD